MREFNDKVLKFPFTLGDAVHRMYQEMWLDKTPIRYVWGNVEIIMRIPPREES